MRGDSRRTFTRLRGYVLSGGGPFAPFRAESAISGEDEPRGAAHFLGMTYERRNEITALILGVFASVAAIEAKRSRHKNPIPYGKLVLTVQARATDIRVEEVDHVLVQLCSRLVLNLIRGEVYATDDMRFYDPTDVDKIDWLYGSGRYATS